jgi:hypothetical protein
MQPEKICQSCSMPMDKKELYGTEKDGSLNEFFCSYCYKNGAFTAPDISMEQMQEFVKNKMIDMKMPKSLIDIAFNSIPQLRRWNVVMH